ncbi:undecaprenyl-diphosphatase UppP [Candidatus Falkowbacteria bacterium]|jgi:undecaprenyl-diphosphatase|nr:undecaprenyl-diphosphatase UppP [Candidatus Falkowbacteria bacterium]MBT7007195.1 undecaprenyl-diphosphatase UppP [Candidatus Falkowbacteria bacterium]
MLFIYSIVLGIVQGITEFLPVSSSGHLVLLHNILNFDFEQNLAFDTALHLGTGFALVLFFWNDIKKYVITFFKFISGSKSVVKSEIDFVFKLIVATIPAVVLGLLFETIIETKLRSEWVVVSTLIIVAVIFLLVEKYSKPKKGMEELTFFKAILIGVAQAFALIPGVSRSGITIVAGMSSKLKRSEAARFAFLLGIPVILGAGFYQIFKLDFSTLESTMIRIFVIGFLASFISGLLVIKFLMKYLTTHKLNVFAWYRIGLAIILILYFLMR